MNEVKLSVVVVAFNVGRFVNRCISTIDNGRIGKNVEIILIDDGSTDDTEQITKEMTSWVEDLKVVRQINSGVGAARNRGLDEARGDYIWFVDGDDFLQPQSIRKVLAALEHRTPDILVIDFSCADEEGQHIEWISCPFNEDHGRTMIGGEFFRRHHATTYPWPYVFRRELLVENGLRFLPRINMQDAELLPRVMAVADSVFVSGINAYVYVNRAGSSINNPDPEIRERFFKSVIEVRRRLADFLSGLAESAIRDGVIAKLDSINRILLLAYVYDPLGAEALSGRLALMRSEGVHPFAPFTSAGLKVRLLRLAVNLQPTLFPRMYRLIRQQSALRHVAALARRPGKAA